ncbi:MAG: lysophospholipase [Chloroflexota bacterium]
MTSTIGTATADDGIVLRTRHWTPPGGSSEPAAAVLLVHGIAEHSGRWEHVGEQLASEGLDVHAFDMRGFGASAGRRTHVRVFDEYYRDLAARLAAVRAAAPGRPVVLYGHSLGGLIALGYVLRLATTAGAPGRPVPDLLVLSAPGLDSTIPRWKIQLARLLGRVVPTFVIPSRVAGELLSRDPTVGQRYHADPLVVHGATAGFGAAALAEQVWVRSSLGALTIPTLVLHGEADELVPPAASAPLGDVAGVTRRTYPGLRHELHNEPEGRSIVSDVITWIRGRSGPEHSGRGSGTG